MFSERESPRPAPGAAQFTTTHWSVVQAAGQAGSSVAGRALEQLCQTYWYPLYAYARRRGQSPADASDLTQSFFAHLLSGEFLQRAQRDKGRFRNYLLGAMNRFLKDQTEHNSRLKRGGGQALISLDALDAEERYRREPDDPLDAETVFVRRWAMTVLDQALQKLEMEMRSAGKERLFEHLEGFLAGDKSGGTYAEVAARLNASEASIKMAVTRLRTRCRELVRETIAQTVSAPAEIDDEYRALISALRG